MSTYHFHQPSQSAAQAVNLEYDLHHIARHNAQESEQHGYDQAAALATGVPSFQEPDPYAMGIHFGGPHETHDDHEALDAFVPSHDVYAYTSASVHTPARQTPSSPYSYAAGDVGRRTRGNKAVQRTDSPLSSDTKSRVRAKSKRSAKPLPPEYRLSKPFTRLKDESEWKAELKNMNVRATWTADKRKAEATKKDGRTARPMNAFMLYRAAWADRCKEHFKLTNHQYVSQILGASWRMEDKDVKKRWNDMGSAESENHKRSMPDYKYQPSKPTSKLDMEDSDLGDCELDNDPDGEYHPPGRYPRKRLPENAATAVANQYAQDTYGYPAQTSVQAWEYSQARPQATPYAQIQPYAGHNGQYMQPAEYFQHYQQAPEEMSMVNATPASSYSARQPLAAIPGGQTPDLMQHSRTQTPLLQQYPDLQMGAHYGVPQGMNYQTSAAQHHVDSNLLTVSEQDSHFTAALDVFNGNGASEGLGQEDIWRDLHLDPTLQSEYLSGFDEPRAYD